MPIFSEANTVEAYVRDILAGPVSDAVVTAVHEPQVPYQGRAQTGLGWHYIGPKALPRQPQDVLAEKHLREALIRLNSSIAAKPDRGEDVLYRLRAIILGVRTDGLVRANEEFAAWLTGERSMPFGPNGEHVTINRSQDAGSRQHKLGRRRDSSVRRL